MSLMLTLDGKSYNVSASDFLKGIDRAKTPEDEFSVSNGRDCMGRIFSADFTANGIGKILLKNTGEVLFSLKETGHTGMKPGIGLDDNAGLQR